MGARSPGRRTSANAVFVLGSYGNEPHKNLKRVRPRGVCHKKRTAKALFLGRRLREKDERRTTPTAVAARTAARHAPGQLSDGHDGGEQKLVIISFFIKEIPTFTDEGSWEHL